jgi:hypothetical protein
VVALALILAGTVAFFASTHRIVNRLDERHYRNHPEIPRPDDDLPWILRQPVQRGRVNIVQEAERIVSEVQP